MFLDIVALQNFLTYVGTSLAALFTFIKIFVMWTPYDDIQKIRDNDLPHSIVLGGASLGFTIPLLAASFYGANLVLFIELALLVGIVQLVLEKLISYWLIYKNEATAIFHAFVSVCVGLILAFSMIP